MSRVRISDQQWFLKTYGLAHAQMDRYYRHLQSLMWLNEGFEHASRDYQVLKGYLQGCRRVNHKTASVLKQCGDSQGTAFKHHPCDYQVLLQDQIHNYGFLKAQHQRMQSMLTRLERDCYWPSGLVQAFERWLQAPIVLAHRIETSLEALEKALAQIPPHLLQQQGGRRGFEALMEHCQRWGASDGEALDV